MYTYDSRVRFTECDKDLQLSIGDTIDYMQDCANFQSEDLGVGTEFAKKTGIMWVLVFWQIVFKKRPKMGDYIKIGTQATSCEKMFGNRNFRISSNDQADEDYILANSIWVLTDMNTKKPTLVTEKIVAPYGRHEPIEMDYAPRKIRLPKVEGKVCKSYKVADHHIDVNNHVNNGQYVRMAFAALGGEPENIAELRVEYRNQATLGDIITPIIYESDSDCFVALNDKNNKPYAIIQLIGDQNK